MPGAGNAKTRLTPHLSGPERAELQWAMLADLAPALRGGGSDVYVFYAPPARKKAIGRLSEMFSPAVFLPQRGAGLGGRMCQAFARVFREKYDRCLLIGSDIPLISGGDLAAAWRALDGHDTVLGPGEDGGYWLVGLKGPFPQLFSPRSYGHGEVLAQARAVCAARGASVGLAATKRDLDTWEDLCYFRQAAGPENAPRLFAFLQSIDNR